MNKQKTPKLRVTLRRSGIGKPEKQRKVLQSLGLRKLRQQKIFPDAPWVRGMVQKVIHLVDVEEFKE